jgi:hypothetical protein
VKRLAWLALLPLDALAQSGSSSSSSSGGGGGGTYSLSVFVCPGGAEQIGTDGSGNQYASCTSGQGSYQNVVIETPWDPSQLNEAELASAFSAGFVVMGVGLVMIGAAKSVLKAFKSHGV